MQRTDPRVIAFLIVFTLALSAFAGTASATFDADVPGIYNQGVSADISINYTSNSDNNSVYIHSENLTKNELTPYNLATKPTDQQLKQQMQGLKNLQTISSGGIPPKGLDEMISDSIDRIHSMKNTVKNRINHILSSFYGKMPK
ncbi:MAG: hypothetical protein PHY53_10260 [Methanobacterium formicicum]|jgi:hypothetical protein|nr:hypothetical protein [Methanobacterium formicicum]